MSDTNFDFNLDLEINDTIVERPFSLPQYNIIEEFRKGLTKSIRISSEAKKQIQRFIESIIQNILKDLSIIANDFLEFSDKKTVDLSLSKKCFHYFEGVNNQCHFLSLKRK